MPAGDVQVSQLVARVRAALAESADGGKLAAAVDLAIVVPSDVTARIQESHIAVIHLLCELVDAQLFPEPERG